MRLATPPCSTLLLAFVLLADRAPAQEPAAATDAVELRLRLPVGKTYHVRYQADQKITQTIQGRQITIHQNSGIDYSFKVESVDIDGNARVRGTIDALQWRQNGPGGAQSYDSSQPGSAASPAAQSMASVVGSSFAMRLSPTGRVLGVEGLDTLFQRSFDSAAQLPPAERAAIMKTIKDQFGDKAIQQMMDQSMNYLPEKPVRVGATWNRRASITGAYPLSIDTSYTLKEHRGPVAVLGMKAKITPSAQGGALQMGKVRMGIRLAGQQTGTFELDEATGWTRTSRVAQGVSGRITVSGAPNQKKPISWPIWIKSDITMQSD